MISVVVPCHEFNGRAIEYIDKLMNNILLQSFKDYEIILSDQTKDDIIYNHIQKYFDLFDFKYYRTEANCSADNLNAAIDKANYDIIKPIFIDDFFYDIYALEKIHQRFINGAKWVVTGTNHFDEKMKMFYRDHYPKWNDNIIMGENTIGCPSVIAFIKSDGLIFDNNLRQLVDTDFYCMLYSLYGEPSVINEILITTMLNNDSYQSGLVKRKDYSKILKNEQQYCREKHNANK